MIKILHIRGFRIERDLGLALPKTDILPIAIQKFANRIAKKLSGRNIPEIREEMNPSPAPIR
jgi:hypothetical protein